MLVSEGASYRLLYLGGSSRRMTLAALAAVERLVDAGAMVVGIRPGVLTLARRRPRRSSARRAIACGAQGRVIERRLATALARLGLRPALEIEGGAGAPHRADRRRATLTFVANPTEPRCTLRLTRRTVGTAAGVGPRAA